MSLPDDIARLLCRELDGFSREIAMFPDDETIWKTVPGISNSAGNLALHVAGNLQQFVGSALGKTGYVRNREDEFGRRLGTRAEVISELQKAADVVRSTMRQLPEKRLTEEFPQLVMGMHFPGGRFLINLCVHAGFHLGQAGYLRRALSGESSSSGPLPLEPLSL
jgi:hypothetical protein